MKVKKQMDKKVEHFIGQPSQSKNIANIKTKFVLHFMVNISYFYVSNVSQFVKKYNFAIEI